MRVGGASGIDTLHKITEFLALTDQHFKAWFNYWMGRDKVESDVVRENPILSDQGYLSEVVKKRIEEGKKEAEIYNKELTERIKGK